MTVSRKIAEFAAAVQFSDLPAAVIDHARRSLVDLVMVAAAGARLSHLAPVRDMLRAEPAGKSRILFDDVRRPPEQAAFYNTLVAAALDYDSVIGSAHADLVVWPVIWAVSGPQPVSGRDAILAHVLGSEIVARLAAAIGGPHRGFSPTAIFGAFGAALAAGRLSGFDAETLRQALGFAFVQAAGTQQSHVEQVDSKAALAAFAARAGIFAANLASTGLTSPSAAFEGVFGLANVYQDLDFDFLLEDLGKRWLILDTTFKKYPVCACSHPLLDRMIEFARIQDLKSGDVVQINARVTPLIGRLVGGSFEPSDKPRVSAQFSLKYALASAICRRALTIDHLDAAAVLDPVIAEIANRISITVDPDRSGEYGPSDLEIRLGNGAVHLLRAQHMPGSPAHPLREEEWTAKYRDCGRGSGIDLAALYAFADALPDIGDFDAAWPWKTDG